MFLSSYWANSLKSLKEPMATTVSTEGKMDSMVIFAVLWLESSMKIGYDLFNDGMQDISVSTIFITSKSELLANRAHFSVYISLAIV